MKSQKRITQQVGKFDLKEDTERAVLGDGAGNVTVTGTRWMCWARIGNRRAPVIVRNTRTPHVQGYVVSVGRDKTNKGIYQVLGNWDEGAVEYNNNTGVGPHAQNHLLGGSDPVWILSKQIIELVVYPYSGLVVAINPGIAPAADGGFLRVDGTTLDLTSHIPGTDLMRFVVIQVSPAGLVEALEGETFDPADFDLGYIPAPTPGYYALAAVRLYDGQTTITANVTDPDIFDLRFIGGASGIAAGIRRLSSAGVVLAVYPNTAAGFTDALADWGSGEKIVLPSGNLSGSFTIPNNCIVIGELFYRSWLTGEQTLSGSANLTNLRFVAHSTDATNLEAISVPAGGLAKFSNCAFDLSATGAGVVKGLALAGNNTAAWLLSCTVEGTSNCTAIDFDGGASGQSAEALYTWFDLDDVTDDHSLLNTLACRFTADTDGVGLPILESDRMNIHRYIAPDSLTLNAGTSAEDVTDIQTLLDGNIYHVDEAAATPGIELEIDFSGIRQIKGIYTRFYYAGSNLHGMRVQLYNYDTTTYDTYLTTIGDHMDHSAHFVWIPDDASYISSGAAQVRFYHAEAGNASHDLYVDYVALVE